MAVEAAPVLVVIAFMVLAVGQGPEIVFHMQAGQVAMRWLLVVVVVVGLPGQ